MVLPQEAFCDLNNSSGDYCTSSVSYASLHSFTKKAKFPLLCSLVLFIHLMTTGLSKKHYAYSNVLYHIDSCVLKIGCKPSSNIDFCES